MNTRIAIPVGLAMTVAAGVAEAQTLPVGMPVSDGTRVVQLRAAAPQRAFRINGTFQTLDASGNFVPAANTQAQINDPFALAARENLRRLGAGNLGQVSAAQANAGQGQFSGQSQAFQAQQARATRVAQIQQQANFQMSVNRFRSQFSRADVNPMVASVFTPGTLDQFRSAAFPAQNFDRAVAQQQLAAQAQFNQSQAQVAAALTGFNSGPSLVTNNVASDPINNNGTVFNNGGTFNSGGFNNGTAFNNGFNGAASFNGANNGFNFGNGTNLNNGTAFNAGTGFNNGFNGGAAGFNGVNNGFNFANGTGFNNGFNGGFNGGFNQVTAGTGTFNGGSGFNGIGVGGGSFGNVRALRSFGSVGTSTSAGRVGGTSSFAGSASFR